MAAEKSRNPVEGLNVRLPGRSLQNKILEIVFGRLAVWLTVAMVFTFSALLLWIHYFQPTIVLPLVISIAAITYSLMCWLRFRQLLPELRHLKQGLRGEQYVAQYLEAELRPFGWQVVNDIPGENFNIDHVAIGPAGIYSIETKTISKPKTGKANVLYDGQSLTVNGHTPDRNPIEQAMAQSRWLKNLVQQSTGQQFQVQPVVIYPTWFVQSVTRAPTVIVQNEKFFAKFLSGQPAVLSDADVHLITYHLKRYVIAKTKEADSKK